MAVTADPATLDRQAALSRAADAARAKVRDTRLDFFRGVGMFIILMAHIPRNTWNGFIPARFGYSDATEIFVFCSGAASAMAFWAVYQNRGFGLGTARIAWRLWQIYWCHIGVFFATLAALIMIDDWVGETGGYYVRALNLTRFVNDPAAFIPSLFDLSYVPNGLDILPMYIVILALLPIVAGLAMLNKRVAMGFVLVLWLLASQPWLVLSESWIYPAEIPALATLGPLLSWLNLPADPFSDRTWFFNPFAWQLVFFTGFALAAGWIPAPPIKRSWMWAAAIFLIISIPLDPDGAFRRNLWIWRDEGWLWGTIDTRPIMAFLSPLWNDLGAITSKTFFGVLRYAHFLALAYLVWALAGDKGANLPSAGIGGRIVTIVRRVGQQSLAVFVAQVVIARLMGALIYEWSLDERAYGDLRRADVDPWSVAAANLIGFALVISVAYLARYFRGQPWRKQTSDAPRPTSG